MDTIPTAPNQASDLLGLLPERWIRDQRVCFGLAVLNLGDPSRITTWHRINVLDSISPEALGVVGDDGAYLRHCMNFTPALLEALCSQTEKTLQDRMDGLPTWSRALERLRWDGKRSRLAAGKLLADRIAGSAQTAAQLRQIAHHELGFDWDAEFDGPLTALARALRNRRLSPRTRFQALATFRLQSQPLGWPLVENALLQQMFSWPLFVLKTKNSKHHVTLPIVVEAAIGSSSRPSRLTTERVDFVTNGIIDCTPCKIPADNALFGAIDLWFNKHGTWGRPLKAAVRAATLTIDVKSAESIVQPYLNSKFLKFLDVDIDDSVGQLRLPVTGESLGVYLSLTALGQFLGREGMATTCATGELGSAERDNEGGADTRVEKVGSVDIKVIGALKARLFDKMIVPETGHESREHLQVCVADRLSGFATHAFGQWSHHRYERCPEIARAFKGRGRELLTAGSAKVLAILQNNQGPSGTPIIELRENITPVDVARALKRVNDEAAWRAANVYKENPKQHVGSFTFIRVVPDEVNERFWHTLWHVMNAPEQSFLDFRFSVSTDGPGAILAKELNRLQPSTSHAWRPPDVLVIVGYKQLGVPNPLYPLGPFSRLRLDSIIHSLESRLYPTSEVTGVLDQIGRTRIILVDDIPEPLSKEMVWAVHDPETSKCLQRLSVFRNGFTFQMARHLLDLHEGACTQFLERLTQPSPGYAATLSFAEGAGQYFLNHKTRLESLDDGEYATLHSTAANSIVGFLERNDRAARLNYREALSPSWVHEAQWHLQQAERAANAPQPKRQQASRSRERLFRIGEPFGWTRLRWLDRAGQLSEEVLFGLWEQVRLFHRRNHNASLHPTEYTMLARLSYKLAQQRNVDYGQKLIDAGLDWPTLMLQAAEACSNSSLSEAERRACSVHIAAARGCLFMRSSPDRDGVNAAQPDINRVRKLHDYQMAIEDGEWFEFLGDLWGTNRALDALVEYRKGILNPAISSTNKPRTQTIVKYLGACVQAGMQPDEDVVLEAREMSQNRLRHAGELKSGLLRLRSVQARWALGTDAFRVIRNHWASASPGGQK